MSVITSALFIRTNIQTNIQINELNNILLYLKPKNLHIFSKHLLLFNIKDYLLLNINNINNLKFLSYNFGMLSLLGVMSGELCV